MLFSIFDVLRFFETLQMFFFKFLFTLSWWRPLSYRNQSIDLLSKSMAWLLCHNGLRHEELKWGKNEEKCWGQLILLNRGLYFFSNGHIRNVVSTLPNVVNIDGENDNVVSTLSNVVQFNVEKHNVVSTLFYVVNFNVDIHNVVSTLIWRCATSRRHINPKTTLNRRWNVCWVVAIKNFRFLFNLKDVLPKSKVCVREESVLSDRVQSRLLKVLKKVLLSLTNKGQWIG